MPYIYHLFMVKYLAPSFLAAWKYLVQYYELWSQDYGDNRPQELTLRNCIPLLLRHLSPLSSPCPPYSLRTLFYLLWGSFFILNKRVQSCCTTFLVHPYFSSGIHSSFFLVFHELILFYLNLCNKYLSGYYKQLHRLRLS